MIVLCMIWTWCAGSWEKHLEVFAQGTALHPEIAAMDDVDTIAIVLKFPSGALATIDLSRHSSYGYDQRLEVRCNSSMVDNIHCVVYYYCNKSCS